MKAAQYDNIKFNLKKPDWQYLRKLAITIYMRLREKVRDSEVLKIMSPPNRRGLYYTAATIPASLNPISFYTFLIQSENLII